MVHNLFQFLDKLCGGSDERGWEARGFGITLSRLGDKEKYISVSIALPTCRLDSDDFTVDAKGTVSGIIAKLPESPIPDFPNRDEFQPEGMDAAKFMEVCRLRAVALLDFLQQHMPVEEVV